MAMTDTISAGARRALRGRRTLGDLIRRDEQRRARKRLAWTASVAAIGAAVFALWVLARP